MSKIRWDQDGERLYRTGVNQVVLYPKENAEYPKGVAWNGVTSINESSSGGESEALYADNIKYLELTSAEDKSGTINAYSSPKEFDPCDGTAEAAPGLFISQQSRKQFGLSYRTILGNDTLGDEYGYELKLIYNAKASPSEKENSTVNESPEAAELSWEYTTTPVAITETDPNTGKVFKPSAVLTINSTGVSKEKLAQIEEILYGKDGTYSMTTDSSFEAGKDYYEQVGDKYVKTEDFTKSEDKTYYELNGDTAPRLPSPDEVIKMLKTA